MSTLDERRSLLPASGMPVFVYLILFFVIPVSILILYSFWTPGFYTVIYDFTLDNYKEIFTNPVHLSLLLKSLGVGLLTACTTIPVGFLAAYTITFRLSSQWGTRILVLIMISMLSSYLVRIYSWKTILGPKGVINQILIGLGLIDEPLGFLLYGKFALIVTLTYFLVPYATLPIYSALQNIKHDWLEASRDLGASSVFTFFRVILPLSMPGLIPAFLFCFILATADYVTPQFVGGRTGLMLGKVISDYYGPAGNYPFGAALSQLLLLGFVSVIALLALGKWALARIHLSPNRRSPADPRHSAALRILHKTLGAIPWLEIGTVLVLIFLYFPLAIVVIFSFNTTARGIFPLTGFTLNWYVEVFTSAVFMRAVRSSLLLGTIAVIGSLLIGTPAAFALVRRKFIFSKVLHGFIFGPLAVPGLIIGIALLSLAKFARLEPGLHTTAVAHILISIPYVVFVTQARMTELDWTVEEAARDLGASVGLVWRKILLPLIAPSLVGAGILVFALSLDEFILTNFVIGANSTLPVLIWSMMRRFTTPAVNAASSLILAISLILISVAAFVLWGRQRIVPGVQQAQPEPDELET